MERTVAATRVAKLLGSSVERSPAYLGIADGLRLLISDGRIPPGTRLPSERELTGALGVSRTTVTRGYAKLREQGYLDSRQGSGSVARLPAARGGRRDHLLAPRDVDPGAIDLTCAAADAPPGTALAYETAVAELPSFLSGTGYYPSGLPALRAAIAQRYVERGLDTDPEQIVVTAGALGATAVGARALLGPGDRVLVESPTYPNAIATLRGSGARIVSTPVDPNGWDVAAMVATLRQASPTAAFLIPDFHNPTGALMNDDQRAEVGAALTLTRTSAIIDESLVEVAIDDVAMPRPFATYVSDSLSIGSASKAFWGGLRIGWIRATTPRVGSIVAARLGLDLGAPLLEQLVLTHLLRERRTVLRDQVERLSASRAALESALRTHLPSWRFEHPAGGLALWCELPEPLSSALTTAAERHQVLLAAGPSFAPEGGLESFLRIPYTSAPHDLTTAVERLAVAWEDARRHRSVIRGRTPLVA